MTEKYEIEINYVEGWKDEAEDPDAPTHGGFIVGWSAKNIGFGELTVYYKDGKLQCHSECMSQEFCEVVLNALAKQWVRND